MHTESTANSNANIYSGIKNAAIIATGKLKNPMIISNFPKVSSIFSPLLVFLIDITNDFYVL